MILKNKMGEIIPQEEIDIYGIKYPCVNVGVVKIGEIEYEAPEIKCVIENGFISIYTNQFGRFVFPYDKNKFDIIDIKRMIIRNMNIKLVRYFDDYENGFYLRHFQLKELVQCILTKKEGGKNVMVQDE